MTEQEYIDCTNVATIRQALFILTNVNMDAIILRAVIHDLHMIINKIDNRLSVVAEEDKS